jgi:hypothetical protein
MDEARIGKMKGDGSAKRDDALRPCRISDSLRPAVSVKRMTAWRTDPNKPLSTAADLAEKYKDLGWGRLYKSEQRRIRQNPDEVCEHLTPEHVRALALILGIEPPVRKSTKPLPSRGKDALMERIRAAHRAFRGDARSQNG